MRLTLVIFSLLFWTGLMAQPGEMSLSDAIEIALNNNIRLQRENNTLLQNQASFQAAKLNIAPNISAQANAGSQTGNSFNQQEGQVVNGTINFVSASIGANMPIFNGFANTNQVRSNRALFQSQEFNVQRTEQEIISQVAAQFLQTLLSQELLTIERENLELQNTNLRMIENEVLLGAKAEVDKFNQISIVKTAELNVFRAEVALRNDKTTLAQILQMDPTLEFKLISPEFTTHLSEEELNELDPDQHQRKDLTSMQMLEESGRFQMMVTRSNFMPTIDAFANYGSRYNQVVGFQSRPFDQQFFTDNTYINYGLALNIPIFSGLQSRSQYIRDKITYENAVLDRKELELTVKSDIQRAILNYRDAIKNLEFARAAMEAARESFELNKESFELGLTSLVDFSQSNRDYFQAKSDMIQAELTLTFQDILLKDALGTLSGDDIVR